MIFQKDIFTDSAFLIVDFDNFFPFIIEELNEIDLERRLKMLVKDIIAENINIEEIKIRLYGGWYSGGVMTPRASLLQQKLSLVKVFPYIDIRTRVHIRGDIELATSLIGLPKFIWDNTLVEKHGINQVRVEKKNMTNLCEAHLNNCPAKILESFTKKKTRNCPVENCSVIQKDIFKGVAQKMVDNMIACDFLTLCSNEKSKIVYVISDDTDHFPSFALGASLPLSKNIILGFANKQYIDRWSDLFQSLENVKVNIVNYDN